MKNFMKSLFSITLIFFISFLIQEFSYAQISSKNGETYTTEITIKFKTKALETDVHGFAEIQNLKPEFKSTKDFLLKYGKVQFRKVFPNTNWGDTIKNDVQGKLVKVKDVSQFYILKFPYPVKMWDMVKSLRNLPGVQYADPPVIAVNEISPNDTYYQAGSQWYLSKIQAEWAWGITTGSSSIKIAIIDDGVNALHSDLSSKISGGESGYSDGNENHRTLVAGVAGAKTNNNSGMASLGWNILLQPYNDKNGTRYWTDIATAVNNGANILNCSWGLVTVDPNDDNKYINYDYSPLRTAVANAISQGRIVVASAGNPPESLEFPDGKVRYPSQYPPCPIYANAPQISNSV